MKTDPRFHACIMAGGSGERFWPMSRVRAPKHLLRFFSKRTLLEETLLRVKGVVAPKNTWILTNAAQVPLIRKALPGFPRRQIVAEPAKRDTGPAAALATGLVRARDPGAVVALLPADALIRNAARFSEQLAQAFAWAAGDGGSARGLLTFAVPPTHAATGFGYLELGSEFARGSDGSRFLRVKHFVEKPDERTARRYVASGSYAWNAGIFVWGVGQFLAEVERTAPRLAAFVRDFPAGDPARYLASRFASLPKISVDYAVLEKAACVATVVAQFDWDDVGAWTALAKHLAADGSGNVSRGPVAMVGTSRTIAVSNGRVIALCGVRDLVVVETPDALLVCHRDAVQDIKSLMPLLPRRAL
ncbi:MAG TPA: sugar phosphate nucleotidyltransferase [Opitutaceae bacterium]|nr:sugar phosphate nucleotidyltransferase [Opitutaceae bacterium]